MDSGPHPTIDQLLLDALERPPAARDAFLAAECGDDAELRRRVEACLDAYDRAGALLTAPAGVELRKLLDSRLQAGPAQGDEHAVAAWNELLESIGSRKDFEDRYRSREEVARGGMGAIYRVFDENLRRVLAMKVILEEEKITASMAVTLARFLEEAQVTAQLDHPGIVPVHELGVDPAGKVFFTMKLVKGENLSVIFEKVKAGEDGWNLVRALNVLLRACEALAFAHARGVVHRDLKPANIMVGQYGETLVMDWGLARVLDKDDTRDLRLRALLDGRDAITTDRKARAGTTPDSPLVTMDGHVIGTPVYMAPEQAQGRLEEVGPRSDVYGMGAILYQLLTGQVPYVRPGSKESPHEILSRVLDGPPPPLHSLHPDVPAELSAICERAMARDPTRRYATMAELAQDLRAYLEHRVVAAYETGPLAELKKWVERNKGVAATAAGAAVILAAVLWWSFTGIQSERDRAESNEKAAMAERDRADARKAEFDQLKGVVVLQLALEQEGSLYPPWPERVTAMEAWLATDAAALLALKPTLRRTIGDLERRALPRSSAEDPVQLPEPSEQFLYDTLSDLAKRIATFEAGPLARVEERLAWARRIDELTRDHPKAPATWEDARESIAAADGVLASELYGEHPIDLVPQTGLVPIGMNPATGLWEFYHLRSAWDPGGNLDPSALPIPAHDADGGLEIGDGTGLVFVLIPGGTYRMGASKKDPDAPRYDPRADPDESPIHEVVLGPYLLSRYEMTQGQWLRLTGVNPSWWTARYPEVSGLDYPVENVDWETCVETLGRFGLVLPTEAQWEAACRGGTDTVWSCGNDPAALVDHANVRDATFARMFRGTDPLSCDSFDDGIGATAAAGSFRSNRYGLFDMHGNVYEWCRDGYHRYDLPARTGDGMRVGEGATNRVFRGGSCDNIAFYARSANRGRDEPGYRNFGVGCRPARPLPSR